MEWVKNFYDKQYEMLKGKRANLEAYEDRLQDMESLAAEPFNSILELGAGGGELSILAAKKGYKVTAVELVPALVDYMKKLQHEHALEGDLSIIQGDFFQVDLPQTYDVICYLDGFGIGDDHDQKNLLDRIGGWLNPGGCALIDIYTPWYWANVAGQEMAVGATSRKYSFDFNGNRMLDTWYDSNDSSQHVTQSLRCYSPEDLRLLLNNTGLTLVDLKPGGAMNYETWEYRDNVPLQETMSYMAKLVKNQELGL